MLFSWFGLQFWFAPRGNSVDYFQRSFFPAIRLCNFRFIIKGEILSISADKLSPAFQTPKQSGVKGHRFRNCRNFRQFCRQFPQFLGNFRKFPAISGNFRQFPEISGNFRQFPQFPAISGNFRNFRQFPQVLAISRTQILPAISGFPQFSSNFWQFRRLSGKSPSCCGFGTTKPMFCFDFSATWEIPTV